MYVYIHVTHIVHCGPLTKMDDHTDAFLFSKQHKLGKKVRFMYSVQPEDQVPLSLFFKNPFLDICKHRFSFCPSISSCKHDLESTFPLCS